MRIRLVFLFALVVSGAGCVIGPKQDDPVASGGAFDSGVAVGDDASDKVPDAGAVADTAPVDATVPPAETGSSDTGSASDAPGSDSPSEAGDAGSEAAIDADDDASGDAAVEGG